MALELPEIEEKQPLMGDHEYEPDDISVQLKQHIQEAQRAIKKKYPKMSKDDIKKYTRYATQKIAFPSEHPRGLMVDPEKLNTITGIINEHLQNNFEQFSKYLSLEMTITLGMTADQWAKKYIESVSVQNYPKAARANADADAIARGGGGGGGAVVDNAADAEQDNEVIAVFELETKEPFRKRLQKALLDSRTRFTASYNQTVTYLRDFYNDSATYIGKHPKISISVIVLVAIGLSIIYEVEDKKDNAKDNDMVYCETRVTTGPVTVYFPLFCTRDQFNKKISRDECNQTGRVVSVPRCVLCLGEVEKKNPSLSI